MNQSYDQFSYYDLYDSALPSAPPRSQFYYLEPLGLNTPYTESLASYISRLIQAHSISSRNFIKEVTQQFGKGTSKAAVYQYVSALLSHEGQRINGLGNVASFWVDIIEQLTLQTNLRCLTMVSWKYVISQSGLLRDRRAWCPNCYDSWNQTGQPLYDLLIWSLKEITLCPYHKQYLQTQCPQCLRSLPTFLPYGEIGYCPRCHIFLGQPETTKNPVTDQNQIQQQLWVTNTLSELIMAAPTLSTQLDKSHFNSNNQWC